MTVSIKHLLATCSALVFTITAPASADGGSSIASAPPVVFGQQQFGNTATGSQSGGGCYRTTYDSWWSMNVLAGDKITVDWETQHTSEQGYTVLQLLPVGTTDYNLAQQQKASGQIGVGRNQLKYTATVTGTMPLGFEDGHYCLGSTNPAPYNFTAYVRHAVKLSLPPLSVLRRHAVLTVRAHTPDGGTISDPTLHVDLQIKAGSTWKTVGTSTVFDSSCDVELRVPRRLLGKRIAVRARAHGNAYTTATTSAMHARVR